MGRLSGKVAIVTGAASGIGRASALLFAHEGAAVLAVDRNGAGATRTVERIAGRGGRAAAIQADTGDAADVEACFAKAQNLFGRLEIVFANAGISGGLTPLLEQTAEDWAEILRVNLIGTFLAVQHGGRMLAASGGGSIICTASVAGLRANAAGAPYSASKAGVISLVQTAAYSFAGTGVRVNAICPGLIETGMTEPIFSAARARGTEAKIGQLNPVGRAGAPDEIAATALFLASDESSYVNGQAIAVDGGLSSSLPYARATRR